MNYKILVLSLGLALMGYAVYRTYTTDKQTKNAFVVGTAAGYAPFVSINAAGEYEGFDIDVARSLASTLGKTLIIKDLGSMTALFMALEQGSIDAIIWGISITHQRLQKVAMIRYHGETTTSFPLIFWGPICADITSIEDMPGKTVCVEPTSAQESVLRRYPSITMLPTERVDDALLHLQYGKADAAFVEPAIAQKFKKKFPEINTLDVPLAPEEQVFGMGITIKKDNTALIEQVQQAVSKLSDLIKQYAQKWSI